MTQPTPANPFPMPQPLPPAPRTWPATAITVQVKPCCELMVGEVCTCACLVTEARIVTAFSAPILLPAHADVPCLTDPALLVHPPSLEMVAEMEPPLRWKVTDGGVSVSLGVNP